MSQREKCLVVGSNSFSGASFVDCLVEQGYPVIGCGRSPELYGAPAAQLTTRTRRLAWVRHVCGLTPD